MTRRIFKSPVGRYAAALAAAGVACWLRLLLGEFFGPTLPYITFYPAVMIAAMLWGLGPGLAATGAAALLSVWLIFPPGPLSAPHGVSLALFVGLGVLVSAVAESAWRARLRTAAAVHDLAERKRAEQLLTEQTRLLELAAAGRPVEEVLTELTAAVARLEPRTRASVLLADAARAKFETSFAAAVPPTFGAQIKGAAIKEVAGGTCGRAVYCGEAVTSADIARDGRWSEAWRELCLAHGIAACHSEPVFGADGKPVASLMLCFDAPREPTEWERRIAAFGAHVASIVIERGRAEEALRESEARLAAELADAQQLQKISSQLIEQDDVGALYEQILDAALAVMRAEMGSLQMLVPEKNELYLLAWRGFDPQSARFWEWVRVDSASTCGAALKSGGRVVAADVETCAFMAGTQDLEFYRLSGIRAVQTTPLVSRGGRVVGMISTHWREAHEPAERELRLLDVLARQAADLIERKRAEEALRAGRERIAADLEAMTLLQKVGALCAKADNGYDECLDEIVAAAVALTGADKGNIQLLDDSGALRIAAQVGFDEPFLSFFAVVRGETASACGAAMRCAERMIVEDVTQSEVFAGQPSLQALLEAGVRAVQSTPLTSSAGNVLGMISTHYCRPHRPGERELRLMDLLALQAADYLQRKRIEDDLHRNEERYRSLVSVITDVPWTTDAVGAFVEMQPAWAAYTGQTWEELRGFGWADALHPDDRAEVQKIWEQAVAERRVYESQGRLWHAPSQTYRHFVARATPLLDAGGGVREWVGACTDVHERKQAEEQLRTALYRFRVAEEAAKGLNYEWNLETGVVTRSDTVERVLGYRREELAPTWRAWAELIHPDDAVVRSEAEAVEFVRRLSAGTFGGEYRVRHKDGRWVWVMERGLVIRDEQGRARRVIGQTVDITERRALEAERERLLREEQQYAERLVRLNAAAVEIGAAASSGEILRLINDKARELIGAHLSAVNLVPGGDWARAETAASLSDKYAAWRAYDAPLTGKGVYTLVSREKRTVRLTQAELEAHAEWRGFGAEAGQYPPLRGWLAAPLLDGAGNCVGVVQLSDKEAGEFTAADEALLAQLAQAASVALENRRLYEQEQAARAEAEAARREAEAATRAKDDFVALVSHELRNPLNAIIGYNHLLHRAPVDDAQRLKYTGMIESSARRQLKLIEDLLDTARVISGKLKLEVRPLDFARVVQDALDIVRPTAEARGIALAVDLDAGPAAVEEITGDPERLQQVVWNLLSNAVKFTPEGGAVAVRLERTGAHLRLTVTDTGKGIAPEALPRVFDRYSQSDASSGRRHGGLGLGLALVKQLVELHGGTVGAESAGAGRGATFTLTLPVRDAARGERGEGAAGQ
jgi:PAS domain S-box-containing protein